MKFSDLLALSPSNILRWTPTASPSSSPVPPPVFSPEISISQVEDEPFMSPAHDLELKQQLDQYVDEAAKNDKVVDSSRVKENKGSFVIEIEPKSEGGTVVLTWEDLCVRVPSSSSKGDDKAIIEGLNGYAQPGEILAIMGPSGCGKSTLLDALAGRLASNTRQSGLIQVNGRKQRLAFGTSAYVTQDDTLTMTLTVEEAVYYSALLQLPDSMTTLEKKERVETTIKDMGLYEARNTRIGGWSAKGLSGGQKRRVSICIEILTRPKLLFLDEPTSGLDSAASYHVMNRIVKLSQQYRLTVIASIHQPSSEVFNLFHNLCLLSSGKTIYFGPVSAANEFFALNGFPCPIIGNPSDHYLRTINKDFDQDIEQATGGEVITTTEEAIYKLVDSYNSSPVLQQVKQRVSSLCKGEGSVLEKGSQASFLTQSVVLTRRSFVNMYLGFRLLRVRLVAYIGLGVCIGSIFFSIGGSFGSIRGSVFLFVVSFLTFMAIGGFPSFVEDMKVFFAYYLVGLHKGYEHFLFFVLLLFICMMLVESLMMVVASAMILNAGFSATNDLPKPLWKYPMTSVPNNQIGGSSTIGEEVLKNIWQMPTGYSKWVDLVILLGMVVLYRLMFFSIIKLSEKKKILKLSEMMKSIVRQRNVLNPLCVFFSYPLNQDND
ncbi:hypothetical protein MKW92_041229 [Papaver armeniacum]|nr:hypothetical protein MKW92_041229 [Papaver armeniacum]